MAENPFDTSGPEGSITTASRVRKWYLTIFRRYKVLSVHRLPKQNSFGEIYYRNSWVLVEKSADLDESEAE